MSRGSKDLSHTQLSPPTLPTNIYSSTKDVDNQDQQGRKTSKMLAEIMGMKKGAVKCLLIFLKSSQFGHP
jgi:hypothetical protein